MVEHDQNPNPPHVKPQEVQRVKLVEPQTHPTHQTLSVGDEEKDDDDDDDHDLEGLKHKA